MVNERGAYELVNSLMETSILLVNTLVTTNSVRCYNVFVARSSVSSYDMVEDL